MISDFLDYIDDPKAKFSKDKSTLTYKGKEVKIRDGIPRFTPDLSYSTGNFSKLRDEHATIQMDSQNGTTEREDTILNRTGWSKEFFQGKTILECGCGAGPDTEILLKFGARVISVDIAGLDVARKNIGDTESISFVQASILDLPFKKESFDIVWCHRVIQHTPDPKAVLDHILQFVKPDGAAFVHSYARTWFQMWRWKYVLWPFTKKMDPEKLYNRIKAAAPFMTKLTNAIYKIPYGKYFNHMFIPFLNYRHYTGFEGFTDEQIMEYSIHDTFDALSPAFDEPLSADFMREMGNKHLKQPFEIEERRMITLLKTKIEHQKI